jgi:hypothetical protein
LRVVVRGGLLVVVLGGGVLQVVGQSVQLVHLGSATLLTSSSDADAMDAVSVSSNADGASNITPNSSACIYKFNPI